MSIGEHLRRYLFPVALFFLALLPRLASIGRYITPDELSWVYRSVLFREALLHGQWSETLTAGHPGVTTTWLGGLSLSLQLWLQPASRDAYEWITKLAWLTPDNAAAFEQLATFLTAGRVAVAVIVSLGLVAVLPLITRLYSRPVAVLACLLMALDPFLLGLSGLLHVDALMTTFAMLSLLALALLVKRGANAGWKLPAGAGIMAALAILTKTPAALLLPITGLAFLMIVLLPIGRRHDQPMPTRGVRLKGTIGAGLVWLIAFGMTQLLLLPAWWAAPNQVLSMTSGNAGRHLEEALRPTFFLGQAAFEHGWLFYPLSLALRLSPVVFAGLILALILFLYNGLRRRRWPAPWSWLLVVWVMLFLVGISLAAKKFDRYALPVVPVLILFASIAWQQLRLILYRGRDVSQRSFNAGALLLVALQLFYLARVLPYPLAAYNSLLGGPALAEQLVTVGWGEGVGAAGNWLNQQPANEDRSAAAGSLPSLAPFYQGRGALLDSLSLPESDYFILTANDRQLNPDAFEQLADEAALLHTVRYGGLDQAWIFAGPGEPEREPVAFPNPSSFAGQVELQGLTAHVTGDRVVVSVRWALSDAATGRYDVQLTLQDSRGDDWATLETPLLNEVYFYPPDWRTSETAQVQYVLKLPAGLPPDDYHVALSLYATNDGAQLPLLAADGSPRGMTYLGDALTILLSDEVTLPPAPTTGDELAWLDGALMLAGYEPLPEIVANGDMLNLDLTWHTSAGLPEDLHVRLDLGDLELTTQPISRLSTSQWRPGETVREKYHLPIPADTPAGRYPVTVAVCSPEEEASCDGRVLGQVDVVALDRRFTLPEDIPIPLGHTFTGRGGDEIVLHGVRLHSTAARPGEAVQLTLYWQASSSPADLYTAFVHIVGSEGNTVAQGDQWPGGLPSTTWAPGQVIVDEYLIELPADLPPGRYDIALGLYTASDGVRLTIHDPAGLSVSDDRLLLPEVLEVR